MICKLILISISIVGALICLASEAVAQTYPRPSVFESETAEAFHRASLPTDRNFRMEGGLPLEKSDFPLFPPRSNSQERNKPWQSNQPSVDVKRRRKPRVESSAEWEPRVNGLAISSYDLSLQLPVYPVFGPPPPFITAGYSSTQVDAPSVLDLPENLHEFSFGLSWMRRINAKWMARIMLNGAFATDLDNTSSDAWQIRGGLFALYRPNEWWTFAFGALVTGRDDIPVIPALGAIWEPSSAIKINLMLPSPRVSVLLIDSDKRQHWGYVGGGISGGTWGYDRARGLQERLTYREWRLVLGWESMAPQPPGTFRAAGVRFNAEVGYVFGREFEFDSASPDISIDDTLLIRTMISF